MDDASAVIVIRRGILGDLLGVFALTMGTFIVALVIAGTVRSIFAFELLMAVGIAVTHQFALGRFGRGVRVSATSIERLGVFESWTLAVDHVADVQVAGADGDERIVITDRVGHCRVLDARDGDVAQIGLALAAKVPALAFRVRRGLRALGSRRVSLRAALGSVAGF